MHGRNDAEPPTDGSKPAFANGPLVVTLDEAAFALGKISKRELYNRIGAGDIQRIKIGKRAFITRESIEAYVERLKREADERLAAIRAGAAS